MKKIIITLLLIMMTTTINMFEMTPEMRKERLEKYLASKEVTPLTPENVYKLILEYDIKYPKIVFSQVMFETGHLKSGGAINDHNLFGFTNKHGHMAFESWEESVEYYKKWQDRKYYNGNYYDFLVQIKYAQSKLYIDKIKSMCAKLFKSCEC